MHKKLQIFFVVAMNDCNLFRFFLTLSSIIYLMQNGSCTQQISSVKYHQPMLNENSDDDLIARKEIILEKSYHGLIRENETLVEITPIIKVDEEKICGFRIIKKLYHEIPFEIELINNIGILRATHPLNCEKRKSYHFEIVAVYCDGTQSASANVHITIIDINEYAPIFSQPSYVTEVEEGRLYKHIIRVEAIDKDCTPLYGDVCKYEILNKDQPFIIDNEGYIKNIEPLSHKLSHNHILSVVAYDCALKESTPVMVNIKVRRVCEPKYFEIPERIDYSSFSKESIYLFPKLSLELCDAQCPDNNHNILASVFLKTKHISFGCDRDLTDCAVRKNLIDLLPRGVEWTNSIKSDEGIEPIFHFDGLSGAVVPQNLLPSNDFSTSSFSIITVFRHSELSTANKHVKEHILCSADDHKMNRHHVALFVRNCRLIFLLRKNFKEGDLNIFSPAEWRWKIPHVCDGDWHHYALNVELPVKVELFIDGNRFENAVEDKHSNPEVIDDWPLHAAHGVNTTLTVGACYQSSENRLKHGFNGDISKVKLGFNNILTTEDVKCETSCAEYLRIKSSKLAEYDSQIQTNDLMNEIYLESQNKKNIEELLQSVQYINIKKSPTVGRRNVEIITKVFCGNHTALKVPTVETYIMVNELSPESNGGNSFEEKIIKKKTNSTTPASIDMYNNPKILKTKEKVTMKPTYDAKTNINISGSSNKLVSYSEIKKGVHILSGINITVTKGENFSQSLQYLDTCSVVIFPSLNPDHEEIILNEDSKFSSSLEIKTVISKDGLEMIGKDAVQNYLNVLQSIEYSNKKPAYYLNRVFKLTCSQQNVQFDCAELTLTLTVLHPKQYLPKATYAPSDILPYNSESLDSTEQYENKIYSHTMIHTHEVQEPKSRLHQIRKVENSSPTLIVVLACIFLVIVFVGISIVKVKGHTIKYPESHQSCGKVMDDNLIWDDSALTITINPMQLDHISDESSESENSESEEEECIKTKFPNLNQLEWDNSNMFASTNN